MRSDPRRVLLVGAGATALTALESLAERFTVVGLVRDPDPTDPTVRRAGALGVPVIGGATVRGVEGVVDQLRPDAVVVSSFGRILPARLLAGSRFVNVHYALLPRYRGRANVNWAILNGEAETGITVHVLSPGMDAGNILFQQAVPIGPDDTASALYDRLNAIQREHLGAVVARHLDGYDGRPQDEAGATYGCTRLPRDGEINWALPTRRIHDLIRALTPPFPGAFTYLGGAPLKVWRAGPVADAPSYQGRVPGRVARVSKPDGWVEVLTGDGVLRLHEVQPSGGDRCPAAIAIRSVKDTLGLCGADLLDRVRALEVLVAGLRPGWRPTETI